MKALNHENLNQFIGASLGESGQPPVFVWAHTARKSLETILFNDEMRLNGMIKASIVRDIVNVCFFILIVCMGSYPKPENLNTLLNN